MAFHLMDYVINIKNTFKNHLVDMGKGSECSVRWMTSIRNYYNPNFVHTYMHRKKINSPKG